VRPVTFLSVIYMQLSEKICLALKVHAQIEEEIFYPQAREATTDTI
jgi:hypothetical protein